MPDTTSSAPSPQGIIDRLAGLSVTVAACALLGLVLVQGWQVIARYVLNDSPSWTEPVTVLLLSTAMSLGAAAGVHARRHFSFTLLADALAPRTRQLLQWVQSLVVVGIGAMLAWWAGVLFIDGLHVPTAGVAMPESVDYLPVALGGALMALFALAQLRAGGETAPATPAVAEGD
jgi:TRAP-type C4-dicarboxylate transport system permease small subunit